MVNFKIASSVQGPQKSFSTESQYYMYRGDGLAASIVSTPYHSKLKQQFIYKLNNSFQLVPAIIRYNDDL